jgi:hypothetical protein
MPARARWPARRPRAATSLTPQLAVPRSLLSLSALTTDLERYVVGQTRHEIAVEADVLGGRPQIASALTVVKPDSRAKPILHDAFADRVDHAGAVAMRNDEWGQPRGGGWYRPDLLLKQPV